MADNTVDIRFTGSIDPSVASSIALLKAQFSALSAEANKLAKQMVNAGGGTDAQAAKLNILASDAANAGARYKSAMAALKAGGEEAAHAGTMAYREFTALFDEFSSGRVRNIPGTMALIATRVFGLSPAALGATVGVAGLGAALGAMALDAIKASNSLRDLETQAIATAGVNVTVAGIQKMRDQLQALPGVSRETADAIIQDFIQIPNRSAPMQQAFPALVEATMRKTNESAASAAKDLAATLAEPFRETDLTRKIIDSMSDSVKHSYDTAIMASNGYAVQAAYAAGLAESLEKTDSTARRGIETMIANTKAVRDFAAQEGAASGVIVSTGRDALQQVDAYKAMRGSLADVITEWGKLHSAANIDFGKGDLGGFKDPGADLIAQVQDSIAKINQITNVGETERETRIAAAWRAIISDSRLSASERLEVERSYDEAIAQAAKSSYDQQESIAKGHLDTQVQLAQKAYDQQKALLDQQVTDGTISRGQEDAALQTYLQTQQSVLDSLFDTFAQKYKTDVVAYQAALDEKAKLDADFKARIAELDTDSGKSGIKDQVDQWKAGVAEITSTEKSFISSIFSGRQSLQQALLSSFAGFVEKEVATDVAGLTERMLLSKAELANDKSLGQVGLIYHALFESGKTEATATGNATRTAINTAGSKASTAADAAEAHQTILQDASVVFGNVFKWASPLLGPLAAVPAGAAFAAVIAKDVVGFEQGAFNIPQDMLAMIHAGEMVVPKPFAQEWRQNAGAIGGGNSSGGDTHIHNYDTHIHFHIDGPQDYASFRRLIDHNRDYLTGTISMVMNRNPTLRPKF